MTTTLQHDPATIKLLPPPATRAKALLSEHASEAEALLSVTMLCGVEAAYAEAMHFREFLEQKLGSEMDFQIRHWTFEEVEHLRPGTVARELAEGTHVLVLVIDEPRSLSVRVRKWIASWLNDARPWYALICLHGLQEGCECLRKACREANVNFFATSFRAHHTAPSRQRPPAPARPDAEQRRGVTHWGINE